MLRSRGYTQRTPTRSTARPGPRCYQAAQFRVPPARAPAALRLAEVAAQVGRDGVTNLPHRDGERAATVEAAGYRAVTGRNGERSSDIQTFGRWGRVLQACTAETQRRYCYRCAPNVTRASLMSATKLATLSPEANPVT